MVRRKKDDPATIDTIQLTINLMTASLPRKLQNTRKRRFGAASTRVLREAKKPARIES